MMDSKEKKYCPLNNTVLYAAGILIVIFLAITLLWHGNANNMQAQPALLAEVYFDGEYRIADGQWQKIVKGEHISSTEGDVTLRGNFHMLTPDGEYVGIYRGEIPVALYTNHINLTIYEKGQEPHVIDTENPMYKDSACGASWTAHTFLSDPEETIEILIHNPHSFGNETAIDELLSSTALWANIDFEKGILESGNTQRNIGLVFVIVSARYNGVKNSSTYAVNEDKPRIESTLDDSGRVSLVIPDIQ